MGLLSRELGNQIRPSGTVTVGAVEWRSYDVRGDERALVRAETGRILIIVGRADLAELRTLAAAVGRGPLLDRPAVGYWAVANWWAWLPSSAAAMALCAV